MESNNQIQQLLHHRKLKLLTIDVLLVAAVYYTVAALLEAGIQSIQVMGTFSAAKLLFLLACLMLTRMALQIYKNIWRYANVTVYMKLVLADTVSGLLFYGIGMALPQLSLGFSCTVIVTMGIIIVTLCSRFVYQMIYANRSIRGDMSQLRKERKEGKRSEADEIHKIDIAIVGAGNVGATLADELIRNPRSHYSPYCFIDRDPQKVGCYINSLPVFPEDEHVVELIKKLPVQEIVVALPDATPEERTALYNRYKQTDCKVKIYDYPL